jgi:hypothetical protein
MDPTYAPIEHQKQIHFKGQENIINPKEHQLEIENNIESLT